MLNNTMQVCKWAEQPGGEHMVSYLPLSHIAAQILDIHGPMYLTAEGKHPTTVWFAQPSALKGTLTVTLRRASTTSA